MKLKEFLNEENNKAENILVNPTKQELFKFANFLIENYKIKGQTIIKERVFFRFLVTKGNIYVGSAYNLSHYGIEKKIREGGVKDENAGYLYVDVKNRKIKFEAKRKDNLFKNNKHLKRLVESNLNEEFEGPVNTILINPTKQELLKLVRKIKLSPYSPIYNKWDKKGFLRFIVDQDDNIYIVNGHEMTHFMLEKKIKRSDEKIRNVFNEYLDYDSKTKKFTTRALKTMPGILKNKNVKRLVESNLNEEFKNKTITTILVNPTKQELLKFNRDLNKANKFKSSRRPSEFRFAITRNGDIYIGSSFFVLHYNLITKTGEEILNDKTGYLKVLGNKITTESKSLVNNKNLKRLVEGNLNEETKVIETILVNPTKQELMSFINKIYRKYSDLYFRDEQIDFRFVYDSKDNLFIGSGYNLVHYDLEQKAKKFHSKIVIVDKGYIYYNPRDKKFQVRTWVHTRNFNKDLKKNKLMKQLINESLNEEFKVFETILFNPTKQEFLNLVKKIKSSNLSFYKKNPEIDFRFILDTRDNLYITSGYAFIHLDLALKIEKTDKKFRDELHGYLDYDTVKGKFLFPMKKIHIKEAMRNKNLKKLIGSDLISESLNEELEGEILKNPNADTFRSFVKDTKKRFRNLPFYKNKERDNNLPFRFIIDEDDIYITSSFDYIHQHMVRKIKYSFESEDKNKWDYTSFGTFDIPMSQDKLVIPKNQLKKLKTNKYFKRIINSFGIINESLAYIKFKYSGERMTDPTPRVKILDTDYPGIKGQKNYGQRKDLLGWNVNHFKNKRYAKRAIDDIESFAKLLSADKDEVYKRIKYFFPEQAKFIRRYMKVHVKHLRHKKGILWRSTTYPDIKAFNKEAF